MMSWFSSTWSRTLSSLCSTQFCKLNRGGGYGGRTKGKGRQRQRGQSAEAAQEIYTALIAPNPHFHTNINKSTESVRQHTPLKEQGASTSVQSLHCRGDRPGRRCCRQAYSDCCSTSAAQYSPRCSPGCGTTMGRLGWYSRWACGRDIHAVATRRYTGTTTSKCIAVAEPAVMILIRSHRPKKGQLCFVGAVTGLIP